MLQEKWEEIVDRIKTNFKVLSHEKIPLDPVGESEILEFIGLAGKLKLVRNVRPKLESKKILAHRRVEGAQIENVYSKTETVDEIYMYEWDDEAEDWREKEFSL